MTAISSWNTYKAYRGANAALADLNDDLTDGIISEGTYLAVILSYERADQHRKDIIAERKAELFRRGLLKKKVKKVKKKAKRIKKILTEEQKHRRAIRKEEEKQEWRFKNVREKAL